MKIIFFLAALFSLFAYRAQDDEIVGTWKSTMRADDTATMIFKKDNTFEVYSNQEIFTTGRYSHKNNTMIFLEDKRCTGENGSPLKGEYKTIFFADSVKFDIVYDSCLPRKQQLPTLKFAKVSKI